MVTIFRNIFDKEPFYITVDQAIQRIRDGKSKVQIEEIRKQLSKDRADKLKANLPSVCFSGKFGRDRKDEQLLEHSGFIALDFDDIEDLRTRQTEIISKDFVYACWVSPRGNGLKALVKIADGGKHREHFYALQEVFSDIDRSGVNVSRVCYESYDPDIYVNPEAKIFKKLKKVEQIEVKETASQSETFNNILRWLSNRGDAFVTGERNIFIFKLASACCRFGISESDCSSECNRQFPLSENSFSQSECTRAIKSAYRANKGKFGTARFEKDILVDRVTNSEVNVNDDIFDETIRPKDVIYGEDVKGNALDIYKNGYEQVDGIGVPALDDYFKLKKGEITLLSGIGNYGKSAFWNWYYLMRILVNDDKFAVFSPEQSPAEEFYHDMVESLLGCDCTPRNYHRPNIEIYEKAYDFISKRIFYVYPKDIAPTPGYIKERFLELIIKESVTGVLIDPFNQLANDYGARSDKYLETFLSDCSRFAQTNRIYFSIIAHPKLMRKDLDGNYPCPDIFDIADGAMWNNKMDNILIYHRPNHQKEPGSTLCQVHTKKIRRQKTVGRKGIVEFDYFRPQRRFYFDGEDVMQKVLNKKSIDFIPKQGELFSRWKPVDQYKENPF